MTAQTENTELVRFTANIVSAYVSKNVVVPSEVPTLINDVCAALGHATATSGRLVKEELTPAVPIRNSVTPDATICLDCGKQFKSLKRHIRTHHGLFPDEYCKKWGLPRDYLTTAAEARSA